MKTAIELAGMSPAVKLVGDSVGIRGEVRTSRMSQQPEKPSTTFSASQASGPGPTPTRVSAAREVAGSASEGTPLAAKPQPPRIPRWLESAELFLRVLLRMYIGLAICYAPWSGRILTFLPWSRVLWDENPLFVQFPLLAVYASNGAVRGVVSGLGLLNLLIAFHGAMHHRDG